MRRIICSLENASTNINGVIFKPDRGQMVSDPLPDEVTRPFATIPGYTVRPPFDDIPDAKPPVVFAGLMAAGPGTLTLGLRRVLLPAFPEDFPDMEGVTFTVTDRRLVSSPVTDEQARALVAKGSGVTVEPPFEDAPEAPGADGTEGADKPPPPPSPPPASDTPPETGTDTPPAPEPAPTGDAKNRGRGRS